MTPSAWALDLDGVIWRGPETVPGAPEGVARLRDAGCSIAFVTNSSARTPSQVADKLAFHGIDDAEELVVSSAHAAAALVAPGERVLALGGDGVVVALRSRGAELVEGGAVDAVIVGIRADFDYDMLTTAMRAVHGGARLIGTNDDPTFPHVDGFLPGNGALLAAVATASGVQPVVAGKPYETMVTLVRERLGPDGIVVGDRPDTDGRFARSLGYRFGLVLSGVIGVDDLPVEPEPDELSNDLSGLVGRYLDDGAPYSRE